MSKNGLAAAAVFLLAAAAARAETPTASKVQDLVFLSGSWEMVDGATRVEEQWTCPGPESMYAVGRTIVNGKTAFFEFLRVEERADGVFYVAQPKGRPPTDFKLVRLENGTAVFENPEHPYPRRITYSRSGDSGLFARVEGNAAGQERAEEFRYRKTGGSCK